MGFNIETIGVIGAGQMGAGIAEVAAQAGLTVSLNDVAEERIDATLATINGHLSRQVAKGQMDEAERRAILDRIQVARTLDKLGDCDLVVEAASENEEVKRKIFTALRSFLKPDAIVASNTSSISITRLASVTANPEHFIGMHFMNPVPRMQLVELIRGIATKDGTFEAAKAFVTRLGKTATMSEDFPAFIVNRILLPMINEAVYTLYEGVGSVEDRHHHAARRQPSDGPFPACRLHRPRHVPRRSCRCCTRALRIRIPPLPALCEIRRGRLARPQDPARLLRLPRRSPGADAVGINANLFLLNLFRAAQSKRLNLVPRLTFS